MPWNHHRGSPDPEAKTAAENRRVVLVLVLDPVPKRLETIEATLLAISSRLGAVPHVDLLYEVAHHYLDDLLDARAQAVDAPTGP